MGSSKYTIEQYTTETSLVDIQLESVNIEKKSNVPPSAKAGLSIQITINFSLLDINDKQHLNVKLVTDFIGEVEGEDGNKTELFTAKLRANSLFSVNFEYNSDDLLKDCGENKEIQQIYIKQTYPVLIGYARDNLNNMGFAGVPIPYYLPGELMPQ